MAPPMTMTGRRETDVNGNGGGFAGLAAAVRLAGAGARVTVLERRGVLGGRAYSFVEPESGAVLDNGQHLFMRCYRETLAFLETLGTADRIAFQRRLAIEFVGADGRTARLDCPPLPAPLHLVAGLLRFDGLGLADRLRMLRVGAALAAAARAGEAATARLEALTVEAWLASLGQSAASRRLFWDPLTLATLNDGPDIASARWLVAVLRRAFLDGARAGDLGFATVGLSGLYTEQARAYVEARGGTVRTRAAVAALEVAGDRVVAVRLAPGESHAPGDGLSSDARGGARLPADAVVAAVPHHALPALLPPEIATRPPFAGLAGLGASPIVSFHLWYDRPLTDRSFLGLLDSPLHWLFNRGSHVTVVTSGARTLIDLTRNELTALAAREVERLVPGARGARLVRAHVIKERYATPSLAPGAGALRPGPRTPLANLVLAGDWTATGLPGTIEGAVASGHTAAAALIGTRAAAVRPSTPEMTRV
jgi:squalene-associated FAD-dependent desaturase